MIHLCVVGSTIIVIRHTYVLYVLYIYDICVIIVCD